ncbi:polysaccharide pyruvyl transferase family protein [Microbacterium sp. ARD31]|uniref:polysaccharide pyruvyl transferase family protein n=1 Tax=Microbacterium sp. ARD31 TaxID=2962576 RepID=UPI0028812440|nr:polysaccharide pyruvyl transferase family protein [Microbacterium sp. ARD31]MDT0186461.1 polysaccharide pyruvyl transferase family protein [Microbacterium sp. ARD31]
MMLDSLRAIRVRTREVLARRIEPGSSVALLDYPYYPNAGDVLIWAGTRAYLDDLQVEVRYQERHDRYSRDELTRRHPRGPILLQGGGNFGDRWPAHQEFRERVISDFPDRHIVQLPQTIEMAPATAVRVRGLYRQHPNLTVLLRDSGSVRAAEALFPDIDTEFCPDLAFGYSAARRRRRPAVDVMELKRDDSESVAAGSLFSHQPDITTEEMDWGLSSVEQFRWAALRAPRAVGRRVLRQFPSTGVRDIAPPYNSFTRLVLRSAERILSRGSVVVTDRLHAVVLAALMGIPVVARDNGNHKVSTIVGDYLGRLSDVRFATDSARATEQVVEFLRDR